MSRCVTSAWVHLSLFVLVAYVVLHWVAELCFALHMSTTAKHMSLSGIAAVHQVADHA